MTTPFSLAVLLGALVVAGCADDGPEKHLVAAKQHLEKRDTKAAVIEIKNALQKNPEMGEARLMLANALMKDGNPVAAEVEFRKALASKIPAVQVVPELARAMLQIGQGKKVIDEFGFTKLGNPTADASLQTTLAAAYASLGRPEQAKAALDAALSADPGYAPARLISARQMAATGDVDGANAIVDAMLAGSPEDTAALKFKGDLLMFGRNPDEAIAAYRRALQADPKYLPAHFAALTVLLQQGKADDAAKQFESLRQVAPGHPQTKFYEAQIAFLKRDFKRARGLATELVQQVPNNALVLQLAGATELQAGSPAQAEIYLSKALQIAPRLLVARRLLIATYLRAGLPAKALTELSVAAGKEGALDPTLFALAGEVYLQNGEAKKAEEYFARALKLDPDNPRNRTALAITRLASGQTEMALDELQSIAAADTGFAADMALISAHLRRRDYDKALAAIDRLEKKQPDKPIAAYLRGRTLLAKSDIAGARRSFEHALTIDPNFFAAAASLATLDMADKKPDDAKRRFEALLSRSPRSVPALLALARVSLASGANQDDVAALLNRAVQADPADAAPRVLLIDLYLRNQDKKQALAVAQSAVAAVPNDPQLLESLGRVQQIQGDFNQAIATYSKLAAIQPMSPIPLIRLSEAQYARKDSHAAEQSLLKALELKPDYLEAQHRLIMLLIDSRRFAEANKIARTVQQQRPNVPAGLVLEGDIASAEKNWPSAAVAYRAALKFPQPSETPMKLHLALEAAGKVSEAEAFAASWLKNHPRDVGFLAYLGDRAIGSGNYVSAEKIYASIVSIQPQNAAALNNLAWALSKLQREEAVGYAERAVSLMPGHPAFLDTLAMLLAEKGQIARALELERQALALQPTNESIRVNYAKILLKSGDKEGARRDLEAVLKTSKNQSTIAEASSLLKAL